MKNSAKEVEKKKRRQKMASTSFCMFITFNTTDKNLTTEQGKRNANIAKQIFNNFNA